MNFNKIILGGHITRDIELIYTAAQTPIAKFGIAVNHRWTGKDGSKHEDVCFVDCTAMGRIGENINKYFGKGRPILIEGRLHLEQWKNQDGQNRSKHVVMVNGFTFVDSGETKPDETDTPAEQDNAPPDDCPF